MAQSTANAWNIGDIFLGIGYVDQSIFSLVTPGLYRGFNLDGSQKTDPDLSDAEGDWTTGCAVDPTVAAGDLFTTAFGPRVSRIPNAIDPVLGHGPATYFDFTDSTTFAMASGVNALPAELTGGTASLESVVFDREGNMYLGAQIPPTDATTWAGHGWIIKVSKPTSSAVATVLAWWLVDAGKEQNPTHDPKISQDVHGVDWLDLSNDETTIYYTSEDNWIRSYRVADGVDGNGNVFSAGTQGPAIQVHESTGGIGGKMFALRILPPGIPANGFLVATTSAVYRVDATGAILRGYFDAATLGYFALNVTPDGASFWTATLTGQLYKFHIASGAMSGPYVTGTQQTYGLCVKREYTAAQNVCFATDPAGISDGSVIPVCTLPPTPEYCGANPTDPACVAPGTPSLSLTNLTNNDGDPVTVQLHATDPWAQGLTWSVTNLPPGMDANGNAQPLQVSSTGLITGYIQWGDSQTPQRTVKVTVTNSHGQSATGQFVWTINNVNSPPTLTYVGGARTDTVGFAFSPAIVMSGHDPDLNTLFLTGNYTQYADSGFTRVIAQQSGLPLGLTLPVDSLGRTAVGADTNWAIPLGGAPQVTGSAFPMYFRVTVTACDCDGNWNQTDPTLVQLHHVSASVDITITNQKPTFTASNQLTVQNVPATYTGLKTSATDPDGPNHLPITFTLAPGSGPLPQGLTLASDGTISGTPTQYGSFPLTVRGTDKYGAFTDQPFKWDVNAPPAFSVAQQVTFLTAPTSGVTSYVVAADASDPDGDLPFTYAATHLPPGFAFNATTHTISLVGTAVAGSTSVNVSVTDNRGATTTKAFTWTVDTPPTLVVPDKMTLLGASVSYQIAASDPDVNQSLTYTVTGLPGGLSCGDVCTGLITGTANVDNSATNGQLVTVKVTDPFGASVTASFRWLVTPSQPVCTAAAASVTEIWPPNHQMVPINVLGIYDRDPNVPFTIRIDRILQDEPTNSLGDGNTEADGRIDRSIAWVRAERAGTPSVPGNGRVYEIQFTAVDQNGATCSSFVLTGVPHDQRPGHVIVDDGVRYDSTVPGGPPVGGSTPLARLRNDQQ